MDHSGITANCASCHNGRTAKGKSNNHIATNAPCETCHRSTRTFAGARMDHSGVTGNCAACHNGRTATGKPNRHFVTSAPCETCHRTSGWTPLVFRHSSPAYPDHGRRLDCTSCHKTNAQTIPWQFSQYRPDCAACHANDFKPREHKKYKSPTTRFYTAGELRDCSGACHEYTDSSMTTIRKRRSGEHRANKGDW